MREWENERINLQIWKCANLQIECQNRGLNGLTEGHGFINERFFNERMWELICKFENVQICKWFLKW